MNKPDPTEYIRLIKAALAQPTDTLAGELKRQALYNEAGAEAARLRNGGWTADELKALVAQETGRRV